ncbi:histidinol-phosphate transaminase [Dactylosporangium sp. NPDC051485]|uniref:pyridoxal phosphate-dependent aminotransferase n=1 Tax=Dactylosporangium sp. NPDC051485 TaxID=3154846 RepID=UPI00341B22AF
MRLSLSESSFGCSPAARHAAEAAVADLDRYPDPRGEALAGAIAAAHGVAAGQVVLGNGIDELLLLSALSLVDPDCGGVVTANTYAGHAHAVAAANAPLCTVALRDGRIDVDAVIASVRPGAVVYLCNPHNPTGTALRPPDVDAIVHAVAAAGASLVLDEAYIEFATSAQTRSAVPHVRDGAPLVVLRTFSKLHGLAGLRCGYAITTPALAEHLRRLKNVLVFNVNRVALAAAEASLRDGVFADRVRVATRSVLDDFRSALDGTQWASAGPTAANFALVHTPLPAELVTDALARRRIRIRGGTALGFPQHVRIAAGRPDDMRRVADALGELAARTGRRPDSAGAVPRHMGNRS